MDDEDHYLLSGHLGPGILYVIDVRTNKLVKAIPGVPGITGLEYVPGLRKVYTSNWGENKIGVVDLKEMKVIKRLPTGEKPNGSTYAEPFGKVYVSDTNAKQEAIVDVHKDVVIKTLSFDSETLDTAIRSSQPQGLYQSAQRQSGYGGRSFKRHRNWTVSGRRMRA